MFAFKSIYWTKETKVENLSWTKQKKDKAQSHMYNWIQIGYKVVENTTLIFFSGMEVELVREKWEGFREAITWQLCTA